MKYPAIVTDVFQVLVHGKPDRVSPDLVLAGHVRWMFNLKQEDAHIKKLLQDSRVGREQELEDGALSYHARLNLMLRPLGIEATPEQLKHLEGIECRAVADALELYPDARKALDYISATEKVVACCNCTEPHYRAVRQLGVPDGSYSVRAGFKKPHPRLFQQAAAIAGVKTDGCVMIEDTPENLDAAEKLGMICLLVGHADGTAGKQAESIALEKGWLYAPDIGYVPDVLGI